MAGYNEVFEIVVDDSHSQRHLLFVTLLSVQITAEISGGVAHAPVPVGGTSGDFTEPFFTNVAPLVVPVTTIRPAPASGILVPLVVPNGMQVVEQFPQTDSAFGSAK